MTTEVLHRIDRPYEPGIIEVYTLEAGGASYEWRIIDRGAVIADSHPTGYGSPAVALRDAISADLDATEPQGPFAVLVHGKEVSTHHERAEAEAAWKAADGAYRAALEHNGWSHAAADEEAEIHIGLGAGLRTD